jgi:hypothetical protein
MPEKICRWPSSPPSSRKRSSLSEPSTKPHSSTLPIRMSTFAKSPIPIVPSVGGTSVPMLLSFPGAAAFGTEVPPTGGAGAVGRLSLLASVMASICLGSMRVIRGSNGEMRWSSRGSAASSQRSTGARRNCSARAAVAGSTGLSAVASTRNRFRPWLQTACSCASAPSCLAITQGLCLVDVAVGFVGQRHHLAHGLAEVVARVACFAPRACPRRSARTSPDREAPRPGARRSAC